MSARVRPLVVLASALLWLVLGGTADAGGHCRNLDNRACEAAHHGPLVPIVGAVLAGLAAAGAGVVAATGGVSAAVAAARAAAASAATTVTLPEPAADVTEAPATEEAEETDTAPAAAAEAPGEVPIDPGELEDWIMNEIAGLPIDGAAREEVAEALGEGGTAPVSEAAAAEAPAGVDSAGAEEAMSGGADETAAEEETVDTTPLAPGLGEVRDIGDLAGEVADAVEKVGEEIDDLPIDDDTKEAIKDRFGEIGEAAGTVRDGAKTAEEYIEALDENLDRTRRMGIDERSRDFLGWFRVTFRAIGELVEGFVDTAAAPVTGLAGEHADKVEELLHEAVPIKEFGDELSKFPTSAAHHAIGASQRNQIEEAQRAWGDPTEPDPDDLRDLYRFPVPPR